MINIVIGDQISTHTPNIKVGGQKEYLLTAPEGSYDIVVKGDEGEVLFSKKNVDLVGTGNVVGAVDENFVGYAGFGGADDPDALDDRFISLKRLPIALVFIGAVFGLGILLLIERKIRKK